jgi:hypothetical protein
MKRVPYTYSPQIICKARPVSVLVRRDENGPRPNRGRDTLQNTWNPSPQTKRQELPTDRVGLPMWLQTQSGNGTEESVFETIPLKLEVSFLLLCWAWGSEIERRFVEREGIDLFQHAALGQQHM